MTKITRKKILDNWCDVIEEVSKIWEKNNMSWMEENEDGDYLMKCALRKVGYFKYQGTDEEKDTLMEEIYYKDLARREELE